jgi:hypothetical protein
MSVRREELINKMIALQSEKKFGDWSKTNEEHKLFSLMLSDEGWYIDYGTAIRTLSGLYIHQITTNSEVLDTFMIKFYKKKLRKISRFFRKNHPQRYLIIKKALQAHRRGDFELSIPVILTQIEGLFYDLTDKEIFSKGRGKLKENTAKTWVNSKENDTIAFMLAILEPLRENDNLSASFKDSEKFPNALNRNKILHGRDINYPNELNSYKAISLLTFIGTIVYDIENKSEKISWI